VDKDAIKMLEATCYVATETFISSSPIPFSRVDKENKCLARIKELLAEKIWYCLYRGDVSVTSVIERLLMLIKNHSFELL
jgi:hypothetical protein